MTHLLKARRNESGKTGSQRNVTLDGVVQDPTGEEGTPGGGWFAAMADTDREAWSKLEFDEASRSEAMLLGRGTYEYFAARWPSRTGG